MKKEYEEKYKVSIPVFLAGGIFRKEDVIHALKLGADGIQAAIGNLDEGLFFCGSRTGEIKEITTVHQVVEELLDF